MPGVPEIAPVLALRLSPAGKLPELMFHWYGGVPPVAESVVEYASPAVPFGSEVVLMVRGFGAGATPYPASDSVAILEALLVRVSVAVAAPEFCGAKATVIGTLCPAAMVSGNLTLLSANCELLTLAEETVTLAPVALSVPA